MKKLQAQLESLLTQVPEECRIQEIQPLFKDDDIYPFTRSGHILAYLIAHNIISYTDYKTLYQEYKSRNQYLELFSLAPRPFGETWGENHINKLFPELKKATSAELSLTYPEFDGEFDLWLDNRIRVEVKACRAVANNSDSESLISRAYSHEEAKLVSFKYHYQQLKPSCCDIFIWIGVCRDKLLYWILSSKDLQTTGKFKPQHRTVDSGNKDTKTYEGQVFMTEEELEPYLVPEADILNKIREKFGQEQKMVDIK